MNTTTTAHEHLEIVSTHDGKTHDEIATQLSSLAKHLARHVHDMHRDDVGDPRVDQLRAHVLELTSLAIDVEDLAIRAKRDA